MKQLRGPRRTAAASAYALAVAAVAAWGFAGDSTAGILLAVLLALPAGAPALLGYYAGYGLLALLPGANPSESSGTTGCSPGAGCSGTTTGDPAAWFPLATDLLGVLALTAAAVANVLLWRLVQPAFLPRVPR